MLPKPGVDAPGFDIRGAACDPTPTRWAVAPGRSRGPGCSQAGAAGRVATMAITPRLPAPPPPPMAYPEPLGLGRGRITVAWDR